MRFANQRCEKWSPGKQYINNAANNTRKIINLRIDVQQTFMHYNNAIYMGNMISYKRNGQGIMLYDEGTSAIVDYNFDTLVGHNIFFAQDAIASVLYTKRGSYEIVMRTSHFIFKLPFYQCQNIPNGTGVLIDFKEMKIYHLIYQSGRLMRKVVQSNRDVINNVQKQKLRQLIDVRHEQALKFQIKTNNGIRVWKQTNRIIIGYFDNQNNLDGVCFKLQVNQDHYDNFGIDLQLKCVERGFYQKSRLQNFGQRYFPNGNLYIGSFSNDFFEGKGLLVYPAQQKWVYGQFQKQKLKKMIEMSVGSDRQVNTKSSMKVCLKNVHEQNMNNWMSVKIQSLKWNKIFLQFKDSEQMIPTDVVIERQRIKRQEQQRLLKIQKYFSGHNHNKDINKILITQKDLNGVSPQKLILNECNIRRMKVIDIEPRTVENGCYWSIQKSPQQTSIKSQKRFNRIKAIQSSCRQNYQNNESRLSPFKTPSKILKKKTYDLSSSVQY